MKRILRKIVTVEPNADAINFIEFVSKNEDPRITLLRDKNVVQWIFGDLSFLEPGKKKELKILEDIWGRKIMKLRRPDLKMDKQWTNLFGEYIGEEIYFLFGKEVTKPVKKNNLQPDKEIDDAIIEVKTETYYTEGTAGEKILGVPFKYAEVPTLYGKPLKILCIGGAEKACREQYGNLPGPKFSLIKKNILDLYREKGIEYIGASDLLKECLLKES